MQHWDGLIKTALVGTQRQPPELAGEDEGPGALLRQLESADPEGATLKAAALLGPWVRAGHSAPRDAEALPPPAPAEALPRCSERSAQHLGALLGGQFQQEETTTLLVEWLRAADAAGRRAAEERLPALLDWGLAHRPAQELIMRVAGERGRWLATLNQDWSYAGGADPEDVWQHGTRAERLALLQRLRAADPTRGLALVASTWDAEAPTERAAFVELFKEGLSMDDEPLLEACLDDKRKEVRSTAAELLSGLADSQLVQRMVARLTPLLQLKGGLLRGARLEVALPAECDKGMLRDGITKTASSAATASAGQVGERSSWLLQMLGAVPPSYWSDLWQRSPAELIKLAEKSEWKEVLLMGWNDALRRHGGAAWAEVLARNWLAEGTAGTAAGIHNWLAHLPPLAIEELLHAALERPLDDRGTHPAIYILVSTTQAWPRATILALRELFQRWARDGKRPGWTQTVLTRLALYCDPAQLHDLDQGWPTEADAWPFWEPALDRARSLAQFRHDMLAALRDEGPER